jgi:hypothetical protein
MTLTTELCLAYSAYLIWLAAGLGDFICHWRTDLPRTSGVPESITHLLQLGLLAIAVVLALAFEVTAGSALLLLALVIAHAVVGYIDSQIAFRTRRMVRPVEQHLHSVLDMAPVVALAWLLVTTWPAATDAGWTLQPRRPVFPFAVWLGMLAPPVVLCVVPALLEFRAAWAARRWRQPQPHVGAT